MKYKKIIVLTLVLCISVSMVGPVIGATGGSLGISPANPNPDIPLSKNWFIYEAEPGDVIEDDVKISNRRDQELTFQLDAVDAVSIEDGGFALLQAKDENPNLGSWVDLEENSATLQPGESQVIHFSVTVPKNAEVGDHIGGLVVQSVNAKPENTIRSGGSTVNIYTRIGARMYLTVLGDIVRDFKLLGRSMVGKFKDIVFKFKIKNLGNIRTEAVADIKIYGIFGLFDKKDDIKIGQIFPKETASYQITWQGKERPLFGPYLAKITLRDGYEPMTRKDSSIVIPPAPKPVTTWAFTFFIPYTQTVVVLILLFLIWFLRQFIIWRKMTVLARQPVVLYKVKKGDHLVDIADSYDVSWKLVAKINDIKPPYSVHNIKELYIPDARGTRRDIPVTGFWRYFSKPFIALWTKLVGLRKAKEYVIIVDKGDKKKDIEDFTQMPWAKIAKYNNLAKNFRLKAGVELKIPGKKPKN